MRLLMLSWRYIDHPMAGGAEILTHQVLRRLVAAGHSVTCFTAEHPGASRTESLDGVELVRTGRQWTIHGHAWRWLRRRLDDFDVVVDQINTIPFLTPLYVPAHQRVLFICQLARGYWFRETRGLFRAAAPVGYAAEPGMMKLYRGAPTITISESSKADLVGFGFDPDEIAVIPMALTAPPLDALAPKDGPPRLIMVGRLTPAKFVEEGIRSFRLLKMKLPEAELDIVGGGDDRYRTRLERMIQAERIPGVHFHGRVDESRKSELLARAHVHLFTSHREGWGLVVSEAAAMGTPSVGYDVPGVVDSIGDARFLAPSGDIAALARLLYALLSDPELFAEVRTAAWERTHSMSYDATAVAFARALARVSPSSASPVSSRSLDSAADGGVSRTR
jgi:glycosyltransferase involved in cell wall biosynthesis